MVSSGGEDIIGILLRVLSCNTVMILLEGMSVPYLDAVKNKVLSNRAVISEGVGLNEHTAVVANKACGPVFCLKINIGTAMIELLLKTVDKIIRSESSRKIHLSAHKDVKSSLCRFFNLTVSLYEMLCGTVVIDMSGYPSDLKNLAVAIILDLFYAQMLNSKHSQLVTTEDGGVYRQIRKVILVDEADNIMSSGLPVLKNIIKEGREFGVGMVLSTQFLDHFRGDDEDYRKYMKTWVVHNVENLKRSDVEYVFQLPASDPGAELLYQQIKQLEKHHSVVRIGTGSPLYIQDLPFFRIAEMDQESYLPSLEEPEELE